MSKKFALQASSLAGLAEITFSMVCPNEKTSKNNGRETLHYGGLTKMDKWATKTSAGQKIARKFGMLVNYWFKIWDISVLNVASLTSSTSPETVNINCEALKMHGYRKIKNSSHQYFEKVLFDSRFSWLKSEGSLRFTVSHKEDFPSAAMLLLFITEVKTTAFTVIISFGFLFLTESSVRTVWTKIRNKVKKMHNFWHSIFSDF